jgi:AcrR family transcriptional regulator
MSGPDDGSRPVNLTISQLEEQSGVPRTTVYYYIRRGLLSPPWKSSATRATYQEHHLERLRAIARMKDGGLSLDAIESTLAGEPEPPAPSPDYRSEREDQIRHQILDAAARHFATKGYSGTRIADIISDVGIGKQLFYSLFKTKHELFVASFAVFSGWWVQTAESRILAHSDPLFRQLLRLDARLSLQEQSPLNLQMLKVEGWKLGGEAQEAVDTTFRTMGATVAHELASLRSEKTPPGLSEEAFALGMLQFVGELLTHASGKGEAVLSDALRVVLYLYTAIRAIWTGELDVVGPVSEYEDLIHRIARSPGSLLRETGDTPVLSRPPE